jgi:3-oxoacyl-[acyl-carrier-protein] synthase-1
MRALSRSKDPATASRPFDVARDGFVGTGGSVVAILEAEEVAQARQASPYARMTGWGQASDGYNVAISHPEGEGLKRAMQQALKVSGNRPEDVDYLNAHATSTPIGDRSEMRALKAVFGTQARLKVSSTKALTGHALSVASVMEVGFTALGMRQGFTPGSAHITELDPEAQGLNILQTTLPEAPAVALSNSSGFGGANVSIALTQCPS